MLKPYKHETGSRVKTVKVTYKLYMHYSMFSLNNELNCLHNVIWKCCRSVIWV